MMTFDNVENESCLLTPKIWRQK